MNASMATTDLQKLDTYTVSASRPGRPDATVDAIRIKARSHIQHIWSRTELVGVTLSGVAKLDRFVAAHPASDGWRITVDATEHDPVLTGYRA